jgi:hypothetical protein
MKPITVPPELLIELGLSHAILERVIETQPDAKAITFRGAEARLLRVYMRTAFVLLRLVPVAKRRRGRKPKSTTLAEIYLRATSKARVGRPPKFTQADYLQAADEVEGLLKRFGVTVYKEAIEAAMREVARETGAHVDRREIAARQKFFSRARKQAGKPMRPRNRKTPRK